MTAPGSLGSSLPQFPTGLLPCHCLRSSARTLSPGLLPTPMVLIQVEQQRFHERTSCPAAPHLPLHRPPPQPVIFSPAHPCLSQFLHGDVSPSICPGSLEQGFQTSMIGPVKFYFTPMLPVAREASDFIESWLPLFSSGCRVGVEMVKTLNYGDSVHKILASLPTNCLLTGQWVPPK